MAATSSIGTWTNWDLLSVASFPAALVLIRIDFPLGAGLAESDYLFNFNKPWTDSWSWLSSFSYLDYDQNKILINGCSVK